MLKVRIEGLPGEVASLADALEETGAVLERSRPYPNRGASRYVRVYLDVDIPNEESIPEDRSMSARGAMNKFDPMR